MITNFTLCSVSIALQMWKHMLQEGREEKSWLSLQDSWQILRRRLRLWHDWTREKAVHKSGKCMRTTAIALLDPIAITFYV